jgi:hypothetical protein
MVWMNKAFGYGLIILFEFLLFFLHGDGTWDCLKGKGLGRRIILRHTILGKSRKSCRYFIVKNHKLCF